MIVIRPNPLKFAEEDIPRPVPNEDIAEYVNGTRSLHPLLDIIDFENDASRKELVEFFFEKCKDPHNPKVLWYPSAGYDLTDIQELCQYSCAQLGIEKPEIFIHTNVNEEFLDTLHNRNFLLLLKDGYQIDMGDMMEYEIRDVVMRPIYPNLIQGALPIHPPQLSIIDVVLKIETTRAYEIKRTKIFYFLFENTNFLIDVLLAKHIKVSHLYDAHTSYNNYGNGDCYAKDFFPFLKYLDTKYIISDMIKNKEVEKFIATASEKRPSKFKLKKIKALPRKNPDVDVLGKLYKLE